jgi:hypothetical protein
VEKKETAVCELIVLKIIKNMANFTQLHDFSDASFYFILHEVLVRVTSYYFILHEVWSEQLHGHFTLHEVIGPKTS